jgi:hypothetical protein
MQIFCVYGHVQSEEHIYTCTIGKWLSVQSSIYHRVSLPVRDVSHAELSQARTHLNLHEYTNETDNF